MILNTSKIDDQTIEVTFKVESVSARFSLSQLKVQREAIQAQKDRDNAQRDLELADIDAIIASCATYGISEPAPVATINEAVK